MKRALLVAILTACAHATPSRDAPLAPVEGRLLDGTTLHLEALRGRVVLLDVWATWCVPCARTLAEYARLERELGRDALRVVAMSIDEDDEDVRRYLARSSLDLTVLRDSGGTVAERLGVRAIPTTFVVDRAGVVRLREDGFADSAAGEVESVVRSLVQRR
jgi:thiol-disulfide isomerase/thioredoxin